VRHPAKAPRPLQITCIRQTITATDAAATPITTVLQRLRSSSAQKTPAGGSNAAETRYTQNSSALPNMGLPANGAAIATTICAISRSSTRASAPTLRSLGRRPASPRMMHTSAATAAIATCTSANQRITIAPPACSSHS
jgi:hypothetical protein